MGSFLHRVAVYQLSSTWFLQVRDLFIQYLLPSPLTLLQHPMSKYSYQKIIKYRVIDFWEKHLRVEALKLRDHSLKYFRAEFLSLTKPHPLWSTCGSNPYEIHKAVVQARMLSGKYITDKLPRHCFKWTDNRNGGAVPA